jgi:hypothetical protein
MDHELENLGPERFQQMCQALFVREFPRVTCYPIGQPDGGRDAIQVLSTGTHATDLAVFQVKFSRNPSTIDDPREWLLNKTDTERAKLTQLIERGAKLYVLVTNVPGTAHLDVGSMDSVLRALRTEHAIDIQCWWRDDINRRLDNSWDIKLRYPELLSSHDFFVCFYKLRLGRVMNGD